MSLISATRLPLVVAAFATLTSASAQVERGRSLIGLGASFSATRFDADNTWFGAGLFPSVQYLVTDDFALGGRLSATLVHFPDGEFFVGGTEVTFGLAPSVRYYFGDGDGNRPFAAASAGVRLSSLEREGPSFEAALGFGYSIFFNDGLAIEPALSIDYDSFGSGTLQFSLGIGLQGFVDALLPRGGGED